MKARSSQAASPRSSSRRRRATSPSAAARCSDENSIGSLRSCRVEAPAALPSFFSGLRIAAVYAPIGAVFGEFAGSQNGLGYVLLQATPQLATDLVFAAVFLLTVMSIILFVVLTLLERICCPWAGKGRQ